MATTSTATAAGSPEEGRPIPQATPARAATGGSVTFASDEPAGLGGTATTSNNQPTRRLTHRPGDIQSNGEPRPHLPDRRESLWSAYQLQVTFGIPFYHVKRLRERKDSQSWVQFRDSLVNRWSSLNIASGLIMGAVSTVVCSSIPLSETAFALGILSLLSSLISIGFGTGLMYVLSDVQGDTFQKVADKFPFFFPYCLAIPQIWAAACSCSFFAEILLMAWQQSGKYYLAKVGVTASAVITLVGLLGFVFLQLSDDTAAYDTEAPKPVGSPDPMTDKITGSPEAQYTSATDYGFIGSFRRGTMLPYERDANTT